LQVQRYVQLIKQRWLAQGGVFFEQNQDNSEVGLLNCETIFTRNFNYRAKAFPQTEYPFLCGSPNLWSLEEGLLPGSFPVEQGTARTRFAVAASAPANPLPRLVGTVRTFNAIHYQGEYFGVPQSLGDVDLHSRAVASRPEILRAQTLDQLRALVREKLGATIMEEIEEAGKSELLLRLRETHIGRRKADEGHVLTRADEHGHCLYGPYEPLAPGRYGVSVKGQVGNIVAGTRPMLNIEVVGDRGQVLARRDLFRYDIEDGAELTFGVYDEPGSGPAAPSRLEFRITNLANGDLNIASVLLQRL
jgi:hypothetical protein